MNIILTISLVILLASCDSKTKKTNNPEDPKNQTGQSNEKPVEQEEAPQQKTIVAKFTEAGVLEGAGSYTFKDSSGENIYFVFDDYNNQNVPYNFFDKEGITNSEFINSAFEINYISKWEIRGESEEKKLVNRIVSIKLIKRN